MEKNESEKVKENIFILILKTLKNFKHEQIFGYFGSV